MTQSSLDFKFIVINLSKGFEFLSKNHLIKFNRDYKATVGVEIYKAEFTIDNYKTKVNFWELSFSDRFSHVRPTYYNNCSGILIFSTFSQPNYYDFIKKIIPDIIKNQEIPPDDITPQIPILIFNTSNPSISSDWFDLCKEEFEKIGDESISFFRIEGNPQEFIEKQIKIAIIKMLQNCEGLKKKTKISNLNGLKQDISKKTYVPKDLAISIQEEGLDEKDIQDLHEEKNLTVKYILINLSKDIKFQPKDSNQRRSNKLTVGVDILSANYLIDNQKVIVRFWELGHQERFTFIRQTYYKDAHGAVILSSISNETELSYVENHIKEIVQFQNVPILIFDTGKSSIFLDKLNIDGAKISKFRIGRESLGLMKEEIKKSVKEVLSHPEVLEQDSDLMDYEFLQNDF